MSLFQQTRLSWGANIEIKYIELELMKDVDCPSLVNEGMRGRVS